MTSNTLTSAANQNVPSLTGLYREIDAVFPDLFTPAEQALRMANAKAHYERLFPQSKAGVRQGLGARHGSGQNPAPATFTDMVVKRAEGRIGWSKSSIKQVVLRGERIARAVLDAVIEDGAFDKGAWLDKLTDIDPTCQMDEYRRWQSGAPPTPPVPTGKVFEPTSDLRLECVDAKTRLQELIATGERYDLVLGDPPYGIDYVSRRDQRVWDDDKAPLWCIQPLRHLLKPGASMALWSSADALYEWLPALTAQGLAMVVVPWDKVNPVMKGRECVIIASEGKPPHPDFIIRHPSLHGSHPLQKEHATPKPPEVMEPLILALCPPGGRILDPFMGTAPVAVAAHRLGRRYHGLEIDPSHFATGCREVGGAIDVRLAA